MTFIYWWVDQSRNYNDYKRVHKKEQLQKIYKAKPARSEEKNSSTTIVRDFNNTLSIMNRTTRQKFNKGVEDFNSTINQLNQRHKEHCTQQ